MTEPGCHKPGLTLVGTEQEARYRESNGEVGCERNGVTVLPPISRTARTDRVIPKVVLTPAGGGSA